MPLRILAAIAISLSAVPARAAPEACAFSAPPTVILDDGAKLLQFWETDDSDKWTSGLMPDSTGYWRFVRYVRTRMDVSEPSLYLSPTELPTASDRRNARMMLAGKIGDVRAINCLEALLFGIQADRHPMETRPTEFLAFVLRRVDARSEGRLKIWYYTVDQPGIGRLGPLFDPVEADAAAGWKPFLNLHNHNFFFDKTPVVAGGPWPSAQDAQLMKNLTFNSLPFERTAVTNGFITSHLRPAELKRFHGPDERLRSKNPHR